MSDSIESEKPLPCPFCESTRVDIYHTKPWWISCEDCSAEGPTKPTKRKAIAAWNRRALSGERPDKRDDANLLRQLALDEDCRQRAAELYIPNEIPGILYRIASELDPEGDVLEIPTKQQILQFIRRRDAARSTPSEKAP